MGAYGTPGTDGHGFLWERGRFTTIDFPHALITEAHGVNDLGQVVGLYSTDGMTAHGFLWHRGRFQSFDVGPTPFTLPYGIDNRGRIVGYTLTAAVSPQTIHGFVLRTGVTGPATTIDFPGASSTTALGINNAGRIVGAYISADAATGPHRASAPHGLPAALLWRPPA